MAMKESLKRNFQVRRWIIIVESLDTPISMSILTQLDIQDAQQVARAVKWLTVMVPTFHCNLKKGFKVQTKKK